jgi:4-alpha-glucanotransferase
VTGALQRMELPAKSLKQAATSLLRVQARSDAAMTLVNLEDLWGEKRPQNVPGTLDEYPNWRRRSPRSAPQITGDPRVARLLRTLLDERPATAPAKRRAL